MADEEREVVLQPCTRAEAMQVAECKADAFPEKRGRGCCRVSREKFLRGFQKAYSQYSDEKLSMCCVAKHGEEVLGFIQLQSHGQPGDLSFPSSLQHECEPNEVYVEIIAVAEKARGKGIGNRLMDWAEQYALSKGSTHMTLHVMGGNRAINLYKKQGWSVQEEDCIERCCGGLLVWLCFGCRYTSIYLMRKDLRTNNVAHEEVA